MFTDDDFHKEEQILLKEWWQYLERAWGVIIVCRIQKQKLPFAADLDVIYVTCKHQIHIDELNGFKGVFYPLCSSKVMPYVTQYRLALMEWERKLMEHMTH